MKRDQPAARHGGNARPMEVIYVTVPPSGVMRRRKDPRRSRHLVRAEACQAA